MTPVDKDCYVGPPNLFIPRYDEIHISCCFTWDIPKINDLAAQWSRFGDVKIGGPAISGSNGEFVPGKYIRKGIVITSRGCPNHCPWCFVPAWEGEIKELAVSEGNVVQDNNLLACSRNHINKVLQMLRSQKAVNFSGGLQASLLKDGHIEEMRSLKIYQIWLAYDDPQQTYAVQKAIEKLRRYFPRDKIRCYVLIGYPATDTIEKAESRLRWVWDCGALPFAMRYRTPLKKWQGTYLFTDRAWNILTRQWSRPAIMKKRAEKRI